MNRYALTYVGVLAVASVARADVTIDTSGPANWDGANAFGTLGELGFTLGTFGQTVSVPVGATRLTSFSFQLNPNLTGTTRLQLYVFAWDSPNVRASGSALYSSPLITSLSSGFQTVGASGLSLDLIAGSDVVLVASTEEAMDGVEDGADMGVAASGVPDAYGPGAAFVLGSGGGDLSHLTSSGWIQLNGTDHSDFAFTANFTEGVVPVPEAPNIAAAFPGVIAAGWTILRRRAKTPAI